MTAAVTEVQKIELSDRTCWILGAGASFDCIGAGHHCVPLTKDLLLTGGNAAERLHGLIQTLIDRKALSSRNLKDALGQRIEITVDEIRALTTSNDATHDATQSAEVLAELIRAIAAMVSVGSIAAMYYDEEEFRAENYGWLAFQSARFPLWSILTLNYDTVLDWAFEFLDDFARNRSDQESPRQYENWSRLLNVICESKPWDGLTFHSGLYLKLHGCLELCSCQNIRCPRYRIPFRPEPDAMRRPRFFAQRDHKCSACSSQVVDLVLPPGRNKTPAEDSYHQSVYSLATSVACVSSPWVCVGYSCPDYDRDVTDMLREALERVGRGRERAVVYLVSPEPVEPARRLSERLDHPVLAYASTFSALVASARRIGRIEK